MFPSLTKILFQHQVIYTFSCYFVYIYLIIYTHIMSNSVQNTSKSNDEKPTTSNNIPDGILYNKI